MASSRRVAERQCGVRMYDEEPCVFIYCDISWEELDSTHLNAAGQGVGVRDESSSSGPAVEGDPQLPPHQVLSWRRIQ